MCESQGSHGTSSKVLWDLDPQANTQDLVRLLQTRFGTELHAERFKAELHTRRRAPGEPLQTLYQDIRRLVSLAYPGAGPQLVTHVTLEAFLLGLNDPALQLEVMKSEPPNVEVALSHANKVEAYEQSLACTSTRVASAGHYSDRRHRNAYAVLDREGSGQAPDLHDKVDELSVALGRVTENMTALVAGLRRSHEPQVGQITSTKENQSATGRAQPSALSTESTAPSRGRFSCGTRGNAPT